MVGLVDADENLALAAEQMEECVAARERQEERCNALRTLAQKPPILPKKEGE